MALELVGEANTTLLKEVSEAPGQSALEERDGLVRLGQRASIGTVDTKDVLDARISLGLNARSPSRRLILVIVPTKDVLKEIGEERVVSELGELAEFGVTHCDVRRRERAVLGDHLCKIAGNG